MGSVRRKTRQRICPVCRSGTKVTSATDGRTRWVCLRCDHSWTEGKPPGMGYQRKKEAPRE